MNRAFSLLLLAPLAVAAAAPAVQLTSTVMLEKVVTANGRSQTTLEKPGKVLPGDKLIFSGIGAPAIGWPDTTADLCPGSRG